MSLNSGFATQNQESIYITTIGKILYLCQLHLYKLLTNGHSYLENIDFLQLTNSFSNLFKILKSLETQKLIEPKFSTYCKDLASFLNCDQENQLKKVEESKSSISFNANLNDPIFLEPYNYRSFKDLCRVKPKHPKKNTSIEKRTKTPTRVRSTYSNPKIKVPNSSRKLVIYRKKPLPSRYYHENTLALISEKLDKSF